MAELERLLDVRCKLGEAPVWKADEGALYWADIEEKRLHRFERDSAAHTSYEVGVKVGAFAFRKAGGLLLAAEDAYYDWEPGGELKLRLRLDEIGGARRFNDGKVDPQGRFWVGAMSGKPENHLYRLDGKGQVKRMVSGVSISNGIGWSPGGTLMYYTDTPTRTIWAFDFDGERGEIANRRMFVRVPDEKGFPDGLAVDADGRVWSAMWGGWRVICYTEDGKVEREVRFPVERVTSCAFGGPDLDELYVTTAYDDLDETARQNEPLAGGLFRLKAGVKGLPVGMFEG